MVLKILLASAIIIHFYAAFRAIKLIWVTKYNLSWMLISAALVFMAIRRILEFVPLISDYNQADFRLIYVWLGIATSLFLAVGVVLIEKIFNYMGEVEIKKREYEQKLLTSVIEAEERERKRIAKELHDGLGPLLSSIKMSISSLDTINDPSQKKEIIQTINLAATESIRSIKEISDNLSPHVLINFGLEKALSNFIFKIESTKRLVIDWKFNSSTKRYIEPIETAVYRILCELITNTCKHSTSEKITFEIVSNDDILQITYFDDGCGIDPIELEPKMNKGQGINNIRSRVSSLKGEIQFENNTPNGVFVCITIPTHGN